MTFADVIQRNVDQRRLVAEATARDEVPEDWTLGLDFPDTTDQENPAMNTPGDEEAVEKLKLLQETLAPPTNLNGGLTVGTAYLSTIEEKPIIPGLTARRRAWLYGLVTAATPLLVAYGVVKDSDVPAIVALVAAFLGTTTATLNTKG